jgi:hypothetical protein
MLEQARHRVVWSEAKPIPIVRMIFFMTARILYNCRHLGVRYAIVGRLVDREYQQSAIIIGVTNLDASDLVASSTPITAFTARHLQFRNESNDLRVGGGSRAKRSNSIRAEYHGDESKKGVVKDADTSLVLRIDSLCRLYNALT